MYVGAFFQAMLAFERVLVARSHSFPTILNSSLNHTFKIAISLHKLHSLPKTKNSKTLIADHNCH